MHPYTVANMVEEMKDNRTLSQMMLTMMHAEGWWAEERSDEVDWAYCRFGNSVFDDFWACNGYTGDMLDYVFKGIQSAHGGGGRWYRNTTNSKYQ